MKINDRQEKIIKLLKSENEISSGDIHEKIGLNKYSRSAINRDLVYLTSNNLVLKEEKGKYTTYQINQSPLLKEYDIEKYFKDDFRLNIKPTFNFEVFDFFNNIFTHEDQLVIEEVNKIFKNKIFLQTNFGIQKEYERLTIEFSWKSASIEGNTYTLLETERLIKENIITSNHTKQEADMIINHKNAIEHILNNKEYYQTISISKILELHQLLTNNLNIDTGIRNIIVGIVGTNYRPLDNEHQIKEALERLVVLINNTEEPTLKALIAVLMMSYIQPFVDGNKRTARMIGNAILIAHDLIPVSFIGVDNLEYKKATILFYEQNSLVYFKKIFLEQYLLSANKYF